MISDVVREKECPFSPVPLSAAKGGAAIMGLAQTLRKIIREEKREGRIEGKEEVAKRMLDLGLDVSVIAAATGFSLERIEQLREKSH